MKALRLALVALVALGLSGCGPALRTTLPPITEPFENESAGTVALVMSDATLKAKVQPPGIEGPGEGAAAGAGLGGTVPVVVGFGVLRVAISEPRFAVFGLVAAGAGIALSPVGAAVGAAAGALSAPSRAETDRNMAALGRALGDTQVPEAFLGELLEAGHSYRILPPIVEHPDMPAPSVDAFLELEGPWISLTSRDPTDWTPELRLRVRVDAKLVRASDGEELRSWALEHEGRAARLSDWGRDEAQLLRVELARALRSLAIQTVNITSAAKK